ncbi:non-homologous end-joining DNA ligase [Salinifilum ghardaiensis]
MRDPLRLLNERESALLRSWSAGDWAQPTLATLAREPFSDPGWVFERKLDGARVLASRGDGDPVLWSRNRKHVTTAYPEVADALAEQEAGRFLADGEVVAFEGNQTSFARLQHRVHLTDPDEARRTGIAVYYYLFDLLAYEGADLRRLPLRTRKRLLRECFAFEDPLRFSPQWQEKGEEYYRKACQRGWEGLIAKRGDAPYRRGRTRDWLKLKCVADQEFVVGGFTDPRGQRPGLGALLVGYFDQQRLRYAGKVGTGYDERTLHDLRARLDRMTRDSSPFTEEVRERGAHWVSPEVVAQVGFTEWTPDGKLRHPRFQGLRTDKPARDVVREG